jgi:hypothetical protein
MPTQILDMNFHIHDIVVHTGILSYKSKYTMRTLQIVELILHSPHQFLFSTAHLIFPSFQLKYETAREKGVLFLDIKALWFLKRTKVSQRKTFNYFSFKHASSREPSLCAVVTSHSPHC